MNSHIPRTEAVSSFLSRFKQLASEMKKTSEDTTSPEIPVILSRTGWVEITLTYSHNEQSPLKVEVDVAASNQNIKHKEYHRLPKTMISHMEYLLDLLVIGFCLQIVDEYIWVASKQFDDIPDRGVLEALIPPRIDL
ncbi:MAG: hypothetical protein ACW985_06275 [Candidatus Thorarchaeota archaeon]